MYYTTSISFSFSGQCFEMLIFILVLLLLYRAYCSTRSGDYISPHYEMSLVVRKPVFGVFDQVPHKPGFTIIEDDKRLEISDLGSRGIVLSE